MSDDYRPEGFEESEKPLPRDMPDQQAGAEEADVSERSADGTGQGDGKPENVPDVDEAGAGPRGSHGDQGVHPEMPEPQESTD